MERCVREEMGGRVVGGVVGGRRSWGKFWGGDGYGEALQCSTKRGLGRESPIVWPYDEGDVLFARDVATHDFPPGCSAFGVGRFVRSFNMHILIDTGEDVDVFGDRMAQKKERGGVAGDIRGEKVEVEEWDMEGVRGGVGDVEGGGQGKPRGTGG